MTLTCLCFDKLLEWVQYKAIMVLTCVDIVITQVLQTENEGDGSKHREDYK